jgi:fatty-acyl-CoA synthase
MQAAKAPSSSSNRTYGQMMSFPLTLHHIFNMNARFHRNKQVVSVMDQPAESPHPSFRHRYTYGDFQKRVRRLANVLTKLGVQRGDRVATFAFNHFQHLELYFAIPLIGAVLHTVNVRLFADQLTYIINHAQDKVLFMDANLVSLIERIYPDIKDTVKHFVLLGTAELTATTRTSISPILHYEPLLAAESDHFDFPTDIEEGEALGLCYTSGTTGHPKGVLYSHRSLFIQSMVSSFVDTFSISERDTLLSIVPMFHANAWGYPFVAVMNGSKIVFPGRDLSAPHIAVLLRDERVTLATGVPTVWLDVYQQLKKLGTPANAYSHLRIVTGGSAVPANLLQSFERDFGVRVIHAWGMTETSPLGTMAGLKSHMRQWPEEKILEQRSKQGMPLPVIEMRIVDEQGKELPWDGKLSGEIQVRGPYVVGSYYKNEKANEEAFTKDGWFRTGDVGTIDEEGYMKIVDRTKDLIKSGGEWISSVDLEGAIMGHPKVWECAVFAIFHPKFRERPCAVVRPLPEHATTITKKEIYDFLQTQVAKWWLPDEIIFVNEIPKTSVGKFDKKVLREKYANTPAKL